MKEQLQVSFTKEINGKTFILTLPYGAPFDEAFAAVNDFYNQLRSMHTQALEEQKKNEAANEGE